MMDVILALAFECVVLVMVQSLHLMISIFSGLVDEVTDFVSDVRIP